MNRTGSDLSTLGHRIRHFRASQGLTLDDLGERVDLAGSQLSLIENGKREPKLSMLQSIAGALDVDLTDLLAAEPPNPRAALEIELRQAQQRPLYTELGLPSVKPTKGMSDEALTALVGLHRELQRKAAEAIA